MIDVYVECIWFLHLSISQHSHVSWQADFISYSFVWWFESHCLFSTVSRHWFMKDSVFTFWHVFTLFVVYHCLPMFVCQSRFVFVAVSGYSPQPNGAQNRDHRHLYRQPQYQIYHRVVIGSKILPIPACDLILFDTFAVDNSQMNTRAILDG